MSATIASAVGAILAATRHVLLDFDGPICSIFAGQGAPLIADELADLIRSHGVNVPDQVLSRGDPLDVLRYAGRIDGTLITDVEHSLQAAEREAAETAVPTPGAKAFLHACRQTARPVAVVSNNSAPAVARYLARMRMDGLVEHIEGREPLAPELMKPHTLLLLRATERLGGRQATTLLIGDSETDVEAARMAGVRSIGYANKPGKRQALAAAGADAVAASMTELAAAVRANVTALGQRPARSCAPQPARPDNDTPTMA